MKKRNAYYTVLKYILKFWCIKAVCTHITSDIVKAVKLEIAVLSHNLIIAYLLVTPPPPVMGKVPPHSTLFKAPWLIWSCRYKPVYVWHYGEEEETLRSPATFHAVLSSKWLLTSHLEFPKYDELTKKFSEFNIFTNIIAGSINSLIPWIRIFYRFLLKAFPLVFL